MARIYALMCGQLVLYVGQTIQTLNQRESKHRSKNNKCHSKYIPKDIEWEIVLLEECEDIIATFREQYYYDTLKPFYNNKRPMMDKMEYRRKYRQTESYKAEKKRYRQRKAAKKKLSSQIIREKETNNTL